MAKMGYDRGHKEMAGAYGLDKAFKPKLKGLKPGRKMAKAAPKKGKK